MVRSTFSSSCDNGITSGAREEERAKLDQAPKLDRPVLVRPKAELQREEHEVGDAHEVDGEDRDCQKSTRRCAPADCQECESDADEPEKERGR